jgi:hypothetical protein
MPDIDPLDIPDPETGITPRELAEMGWPMQAKPVEDTVEPKEVADVGKPGL